jgi:hypothetical protein
MVEDEDARVSVWWADDGEQWILVAIDHDDGTLIDLYGPGSKTFSRVYGSLLYDPDTITREAMLYFSVRDEEVMRGVQQWLARSLRGE